MFLKEKIKHIIQSNLEPWKVILFLGSLALLLWLGIKMYSSEPVEDNSRYARLRKLKPVDVDLDKIKLRGKLIGVTIQESTHFFLYQNKGMGYEYEVMEAFANHLGVEFELKIAKNKEEAIFFLNKGMADIYAGNLVVNDFDSDFMAFTDYYRFINYVLVQRNEIKKIDNPDDTIAVAKYISSTKDLAGQVIFSTPGSKSYEIYQSLRVLLGNRLFSKSIDPDYNHDDVCRMVSTEVADYGIVEEHTAYINNLYYGNLDYHLKVGFPQMVSWGVRKNGIQLQQEVNKWLRANRDTGIVKRLEKKWFADRTIATTFGINPQQPKGLGISRYDYLIQKYAREIDWDWRLVAAIVWQESRFNPNATSFAGARGLMQVMPSTANDYGVSAAELYNPETAIKTGVRHLKTLINYWDSGNKIWHPGQRIKFIIASYNAGIGHVEDARRLAAYYNASDQIWDKSVEYYLYYLDNPQFYNHPVVQYGYCRGKEPYGYVKNIVAKFLHWGYSVDYYYQAPKDYKDANAPWVRQFILDYEEELAKKQATPVNKTEVN